VVGDVTLGDLVPAMRVAERRWGREVNPSVYPVKEFRGRLLVEEETRCALHSAVSTFMRWWPGVQPLRGDPRFREVLGRVNLEMPPAAR